MNWMAVLHVTRQWLQDERLYFLDTTYTPELDPAWVQWSMIKKAAANMLVCGHGCYEEVSQEMLRSRETGVAEMSHYLLGQLHP